LKIRGAPPIEVLKEGIAKKENQRNQRHEPPNAIRPAAVVVRGQPEIQEDDAASGADTGGLAVKAAVAPNLACKPPKGDNQERIIEKKTLRADKRLHGIGDEKTNSVGFHPRQFARPEPWRAGVFEIGTVNMNRHDAVMDRIVDGERGRDGQQGGQQIKEVQFSQIGLKCDANEEQHVKDARRDIASAGERQKKIRRDRDSMRRALRSGLEA
jgi:hypothetical protein